MKAILNIFRGIFGSIILLFFLVILLISPTLLAISSLITHRENIITWIDESQGYNQISNIVVENVKSELKKQGLSKSEIKLFEPKIKRSISSEFIKSMVGSVVNGVYDWLEGKTKNIEVNFQQIDLKNTLTDALPKQLLVGDMSKLLSALKPCTGAQALKYEKQGGFKSIEDFCIPPKIEILKIADEIKPTTEKPTAIKIENPFQIPDLSHDTANKILLYFKLIQNAQWIVLAVFILFTSLFLIISPTKLFKVYFVGSVIALSGIIQAILWKSDLLFNYLTELLFKNLDLSTGVISKDFINVILETVFKDIKNLQVTYSLYILFFGVLIIGAGFLSSYLSKGNSKKVGK